MSQQNIQMRLKQRDGSYDLLYPHINTVTPAKSGNMSPADKNKLDEITPEATKTEPSDISGNIKIDDEEIEVYRHPDEPGYYHLPPGGAPGQILIWSADGKGMWIDIPIVNTAEYKVYTAIVDLSPAKPTNPVTYADDAVSMIPGSSEWDVFFGHYPCLFKQGSEVVRLNPLNYTKDVSGQTVNLASAAGGDVMCAFPRRGLKISLIGDALKISMTNHPNDPRFDYYAHQRGSLNKAMFYLGAYKGSLDDGNRLRSWSGKTPMRNKTIAQFRDYAQAQGEGYEQSGFFQLIYRQAMHILKYKHTYSQTPLGAGYLIGNADVTATGSTNTKGMDWGESTGKYQVKEFGIEDSWGNIDEFIDGLYIDENRNILVSTNNFNNEGEGYTNEGLAATENLNGFIKVPQGTSETGFLIKEGGGTLSTFFPDRGAIKPSCAARHGGYYNTGMSDGGIFHLRVEDPVGDYTPTCGGRLMFL